MQHHVGFGYQRCAGNGQSEPRMVARQQEGAEPLFQGGDGVAEGLLVGRDCGRGTIQVTVVYRGQEVANTP